MVPDGDKWYFRQDLATSHTAKQTRAMLASGGVTLVPWMPSGADLSPLDIFVNPELKKRLHGKDLGAIDKLVNATARELNNMSKNPAILKLLKKCSRGFKKLAQWV